MLLGTFVTMIIKGIRQHVMLKNLKVSLSLKNSILLYFAGSSMTLTPGGIGSVIKSYFLKKKYGINISDTFPLVFLERFHDLFAIACIITITLFFLPRFEILFLICFVFLFLIFGFIVIRSKIFFLLIKKFFAKLPKINLIFESIDESYDGFNLLTKPGITIQSWILSIIAWIVDAIVIFLVFSSFNLNFDFILTTLITHSSFLLGNLSIIPAGLGITEITTTGFLIQEGIELSLATSIVVIIRLVTTWFATIIGLITTRFYLK
jgi:glycosyltransferase 2 family protein